MRKHLWAILLVVGLASSRTIAAENLRVGAAASVITPPAGTPMAGYYFERAAEGVHDDLFAKALVLDQGGTRVALVSLDLISTPMGLVEAARKEIERTTGIPGRNVMISATHAHTGPVLVRPRPARRCPGGRQRPGSPLHDVRCPQDCRGRDAGAESALAPAAVKAAKGKEPFLAFNRRFHMTDGTVGWNPGKLNPKILKPAGPIDPEVAVVLFESASADRTSRWPPMSITRFISTISAG